MVIKKNKNVKSHSKITIQTLEFTFKCLNITMNHEVKHNKIEHFHNLTKNYKLWKSLLRPEYSSVVQCLTHMPRSRVHSRALLKRKMKVSCDHLVAECKLSLLVFYSILDKLERDSLNSMPINSTCLY
jgi:hypothetical protein